MNLKIPKKQLAYSLVVISIIFSAILCVCFYNRFLFLKNLEINLSTKKILPETNTQNAFMQKIQSSDTLYLEKIEMKLPLEEKNIKTLDKIREAEEILKQKIPISMDDLKKILSQIEDIGIYKKQPNSPQMIIKKLSLERCLEDKNLYLLNISFIKRERAP